MRIFSFSLAIMVPMSVVDSANAGRSALLARESMELIPRALQIARTRWGGIAKDYSTNSQAAEATQPVTPTSSSSKVVQPKKTVRILAIDGGGIRGIIPLTVLSRLEESIGKRTAELFDVFAGTSTGGLISMGLNVPDEKGAPKHPASYLKAIYQNKSDQIFYQNPIVKTIPYLSSALNFFAAKYSHKTLERFLKEEFEDVCLSNAIGTVIVPAYDLKLSKIHVFSNKNVLGKTEPEDFRMRDVARATSAAPTYFSPAKISPTAHKRNESYELIDGGVSANNPALIAYFYSQVLFPEANDFLIVSLGTGVRKIGFTRYTNLKGAGFWHWARKLPGLMINAPSAATEHCLAVMEHKYRQSHQEPRYVRMQPPLPEELAALDSTHVDKLDDLVTYGELIVDAIYKNDFDRVVTELSETRTYAGENGTLKAGIHLNGKTIN